MDGPCQESERPNGVSGGENVAGGVATHVVDGVGHEGATPAMTLAAAASIAAASDFAPVPPFFNVSGGVPALSADGDSLASTIAHLAKRREPTVLKGRLFSLWPALDSWTTPGTLCERIPIFGGPVFGGHNPVFYHENRDAYKKPWVRLEEAIRTPLNLTCAEFVAGLVAPGVHSHMYVSTPLGDARSIADLPSLDQLLVPEVVTRTDSTNLWLGRGVTAEMHYDGHHNLFAQLSGRKKFLLAPPSAALRLRLFPEPHPRDRHAQPGPPAVSAMCDADLERPGERHVDECSKEHQPPCAESKMIPASEVVLDPGDLLFLPPYHFHRVDASLSELR